MSAVVDIKLLKKRYQDILRDEIFLCSCIEVLESAGEHEDAKVLREQMQTMKTERLRLKEWVS